MSLIHMKSNTALGDNPSNFTNYFPTNLVLRPNSSVSLINITLNKKKGFRVIAGLNDVLHYVVGTYTGADKATNFGILHELKLEPGEYTAAQLQNALRVLLTSHTSIGCLRGWSVEFDKADSASIDKVKLGFSQITSPTTTHNVSELRDVRNSPGNFKIRPSLGQFTVDGINISYTHGRGDVNNKIALMKSMYMNFGHFQITTEPNKMYVVGFMEGRALDPEFRSTFDDPTPLNDGFNRNASLVDGIGFYTIGMEVDDGKIRFFKQKRTGSVGIGKGKWRRLDILTNYDVLKSDGSTFPVNNSSGAASLIALDSGYDPQTQKLKIRVIMNPAQVEFQISRENSAGSNTFTDLKTLAIFKGVNGTKMNTLSQLRERNMPFIPAFNANGDCVFSAQTDSSLVKPPLPSMLRAEQVYTSTASNFDANGDEVEATGAEFNVGTDSLLSIRGVLVYNPLQPGDTTDDITDSNLEPPSVGERLLGFSRNFDSFNFNDTTNNPLNSDVAPQYRIFQDTKILEIPELETVGLTGFSNNDFVKPVAVMPFNQFQNNDEDGTVSFIPPYKLPILMNIQKEFVLNQLTVKVFNSDRTLADDIIADTEVVIYIEGGKPQ